MSESILEQLKLVTCPGPAQVKVDLVGISNSLMEAIDIIRFYGSFETYERHDVSPCGFIRGIKEGNAGEKARDFLRKIGAGE